MRDRVKRIWDAQQIDHLPICSERMRIIVESYKRNAGWSMILQKAQATADYLDQRTIFIQPDELIVGNVASKPYGMEARATSSTWPDEDLDILLSGELVTMTDEDRKILRSYDDFFAGKGRTMEEWQGACYDDERLWPFIHRGFLCPGWANKDKGRGFGAAGDCWGTSNGPMLINVPDYALVINKGYRWVVEEAKKELSNLRYYSAEDFHRAEFYRATIIAFEAMIRSANRYGNLAEKMAAEEKDPTRKAELLQIAETCHWVPEHPARTFREGVQAFWFYWIMIASATTPGGRFDQYMYPLYQADIAAGRMTREDALELLECLRLKIMELNIVLGGAKQRQKQAGMARWHNFIIGGCDENGKECSNELSHLLLDAALEVRTPHPTMTVRVSKDTPPELMLHALQVVRAGTGMPSFISEDQYINVICREGVDIREARNFAIAGCLDVHLPGRSRNHAFGMFLMPSVVELTMHNGVAPTSGAQIGEKTGEFADFKTFEEFYDAFKKQLTKLVGMVCEEHNILLMVAREKFPDVVSSALYHDGLKLGLDGLNRRMMFENAACLNCVGMANAGDELAAIKKLVFDDKVITAKQLIEAIDANWEGYEEIRKMCLSAPKYGNNIDYVDNICAQLWADTEKIARQYKTIFDAPLLISGVSISAHAPGGASVGATPEGRYAGETFADGSTSPEQGKDTNGPLAVFQSAMKLDQTKFQATLMNMKFTPSALKTDSDLMKLSSMIMTYLNNGGKQVQFNVVDQETLKDAKEHAENHRDLIVRVAGYSAYFVNLTDRVQDEIIARTGHEL